MSALTEKMLEALTSVGSDVGSLLKNITKLFNFFHPDLLISKSGLNGDGIYTTLEYARQDSTLYKKSVLSGGTSPEFSIRTVTFYGEDGTTVTNTKVFSLTYANGRCTSVNTDALVDIEEHNLNVKQFVSVKEDDTNYYIPFVNGASQGNKDLFVDSGLFYNPNSNVLTALGDVTSASDKRLKTNIKVIKSALSKVMQIRGVTYMRKDNGRAQAGVIAQELQLVLPEAVNSDGKYLSVSHGNVNGLLIEAIKELNRNQEKTNALVKSLQAELKTLRKKNALPS